MNPIRMNRLHNVTNPFQTKAKKVLCLCSAGMLRSPTAANVLHQEYGYNTRAAGVDHEYALVPLDQVLLAWADEIVCVEGSVYHTLIGRHDTQAHKVIVLNVPDQYEWNDPELRALISKQYNDSSVMEKAFGQKDSG